MRPDQPVDIYVPEPSRRVRARGLKSHVCSVALPPGSFEVVRANEVALRIPDGIEMLVESPRLSFSSAAQRLSMLVSTGSLDSDVARFALLKLGAEDCSSYALDPWKPRSAACAFELEPCVRVEELRAYLGQLRGFDGMSLAREVAMWVFDRSGSPMETFVNAALTLPVSMGSLSLGSPVANKRIDLKGLQQMMLNHVDHITPDLLWEAVGIILEYLGSEPHEGAAAQREDMGRVQDFQALGYLVFPVVYAHVRNPRAFNGLAMRIATAMDERGAQGMRTWVTELASDEAFLRQQMKLFANMLPTVSDR